MRGQIKDCLSGNELPFWPPSSSSFSTMACLFPWQIKKKYLRSIHLFISFRFWKIKKKTVFKEGNSQDSAFHRILAYIGPDRLESTISKITGKISVVIYCLLFLDNNLLCWKIVNFLLIILINNRLLPT